MLFNLKKSSVLFALGVLSGGSLLSTFAWADVQADKLVLKASTQMDLSNTNGGYGKRIKAKKTESILANLDLFRGVTVDNNPPTRASVQDRDNRNARKSDKSGSVAKSLRGALQITLKENLNLVYSPGRLSQQSSDSEKQGLYLVTDHGGEPNWYMGIESASEGRSSDIRRTANSARFGVILSLD